MAVFEKAVEGLVEGGAATGAAVGLGVLLLAPSVLPVIGRTLRPLAVGAIKTGMTVYREASSSIREATEDLVAEARAEIEAESHETHTEPTRRRARAAESAT
jgi:Sec-independent protein translocase protein TatA